MSRCLKQKDLFALLDDKDNKPRGDQADHLLDCESCREAMAHLRGMRDAAREALPAGVPDWSRMDRSVEGNIRSMTEERAPAFSWAPLGLSAAAVALVLLALVLPPLDSGLPDAVDRTPLQTLATAPSQRKAPRTLGVSVDDSVGAPSLSSPVGALTSGTDIATGPMGGVRVAMGPRATMEAPCDVSMTIASINALTPTLALTSGGLRVDVPPGSLERDLVVLAGGETFSIFAGMAEFTLTNDGMVIRVQSGEVFVNSISADAGRSILPGGTWKLPTRTPGDKIGEWIEIGTSRAAEMDTSTPDSGPPVRDLMRPTGTLPRRVIREIVDRNKPKLAACYESSLKRFPSLHSEIAVTARLSVGAKGQVARVRVKGTEEWPELKRCLSGVLKDMAFPPPDGGPLELIFPLRLSPRP